MSNIRKTYNKIVDLRLRHKDYWDFQIAASNYKHCYNCDNIVSGDVISSFNFDSITGMCSDIVWDDATSFDEDLCDIGLTGFDNRFVPNFTGETYNPNNSTNFCIYAVSGDLFCYDMQSMTGDTIQDTNFNYTKFCGGFYQGFYKLHDYDYEVLPNRYAEGWTLEFWLRTEICSGDTCLSGTTLNDFFPDNKGIFYSWGIRAENKFCNIFSPELGKFTCTGVPLSPQVIEVPFEPDVNPFLYYNEKQMCENFNNPPIKYGEIVECCDGIEDNIMAFRITDDGALGVRYLTNSGECISTGGGLYDKPFFTGITVAEEIYTNTNIIKNNEWHLVTIKYAPYTKLNECENDSTRNGDLSFYVDGFLKLKLENFQEFIPSALNEHRDKQLAVPYNISIGGGTQGLLESITYGGIDEGLPVDEIELCNYVLIMDEYDIFNGISVDGVLYESPPLSVNDVELIEVFLNDTITLKQGTINSIKCIVCARQSLKIYINGVISTLDYALINGNIKSFCKLNCLTLPEHDGSCGIIEEFFAGTFIGSIADYRLHNRALCFSEIQCNYNLEKAKYDKSPIICDNV